MRNALGVLEIIVAAVGRISACRSQLFSRIFAGCEGRRRHTLQLEMAAALTGHLAVALDLAALALITSGHERLGMLINYERQDGIIPCDRDVAIPLCARVGSAGVIRLPLGAVGGGRGRVVDGGGIQGGIAQLGGL